MRRFALVFVACAAAACGSDRPAETPAPAKPKPATPAAAARPVITDFEPKLGKAGWAREVWRRPSGNCTAKPDEMTLGPPDTPGRDNLRWIQSCGFAEPNLRVTLRGSGFSTDRVRNAVFFGGVRAFVASADANTLVVEPLANVPGVVRVSVRTSNVDVDDLNAPDRAEATETFRFLGPPARVSIAGGDRQVVAQNGRVERIAVRVTDMWEQGLSGERVWFWAVAEPRGTWPRPPIRVEAVTEALGIARASFDVSAAPGRFRVLAEVVNAPPARTIPHVTFREIVMGPAADVAKLADEAASGTHEQRLAAVFKLSQLAAGAAPATAALIACTSDDDWVLRVNAAEVLIDIGTPEALAAAVEVQIRELKEEDGNRHRDAAEKLARLGAAARPAVPLMVTGMRTRKPYMGHPDMQALKELGPAAAEAVPALVDVLKGTALTSPRDALEASSQTDYRRDAADALGAIGTPGAESARAALNEALRDDKWEVQYGAELALDKGFGGVPALQLTLVAPGGPATSHAPVGRGAHGEIVVKVTDTDGKPVPNERVIFIDENGCTSVEKDRVLTDQDGLAKAGFMVVCPDTSGVRARVRGLSVIYTFR